MRSWVEFVLLWVNVRGAALSGDEYGEDVGTSWCAQMTNWNVAVWELGVSVCVLFQSRWWVASFLMEVMNPRCDDILSKCVSLHARRVILSQTWIRWRKWSEVQRGPVMMMEKYDQAQKQWGSRAWFYPNSTYSDPYGGGSGLFDATWLLVTATY